MRTIVEPRESVDKLWGKQRIREDDSYRLMHYVLRAECDGKMLLHNVVTGRLVILDQVEVDAIGRLPRKYEPVMEEMVREHYLVPENYDEHDRVVKLRNILNKMLIASNSDSQVINTYTILPTTACNARCYYCFEHGVPFVTMSEQTADDTVRFIADHCGDEKKVSIRWFGGEPTVAANLIDQICYGLIDHGIQYSSSMTTNGYLFDEEMVSRAKRLWHLKDLMITVDGTEKNYNEIKSYVGVKDNPYQRVLRNVGLMLDQGMSVGLRMNFDLGNYEDFEDILKEAHKRYQGNKLLQVYAFPIKGAYPDKNGEVCHASEDWLDEKLVELNDRAREAGLFDRQKGLPSLNFNTCFAGTPSFMVVTPEGKLGRCTGIFDREDTIIGNVVDGVTDQNCYKPWTRFADPERCKACPFFPDCVLIEKCPGIDRCFKSETGRWYEETIKRVFRQYLNRYENGKEVMRHDSSGTQSGICTD